MKKALPCFTVTVLFLAFVLMIIIGKSDKDIPDKDTEIIAVSTETDVSDIIPISDDEISASENDEMPKADEPPEAINTLLPKAIVHSGGITPDGQVSTNSLEALNYTYANGFRTIEMDFCWTSDNKLVCIHDWKNYYSGSKWKPFSIEKFNSRKSVEYGYTSITADELADWMRQHGDVYIITDAKKNYITLAKKLRNDYPDIADRFIVQIYSFKEYEQIRSLGYENIILTLYRIPIKKRYDSEYISKFVDSHELVALTVPGVDEAVPFVGEIAEKTDIPIFIHTINSEEEADFWFSLGAYGIYTDFYYRKYY